MNDSEGLPVGEQLLIIAWHDVQAALQAIAMPADVVDLDVLAVLAAGLGDTVTDLRATIRVLRKAGMQTAGLPSLIAEPSRGDTDDLPSLGTPRAEWTRAQTLLVTAYRLADLADTTQSAPLPGSATENAVDAVLQHANAILDVIPD